MDTNTLRLQRGEAMRDFDDGNLPQAEAKLTELILQSQNASDPWTLGELTSCLRDRATVRRFSNNWQEALDDIAHCEQVALRLPLLPRRMTLPNIYYMRALVESPFLKLKDRVAGERTPVVRPGLHASMEPAA